MWSPERIFILLTLVLYFTGLPCDTTATFCDSSNFRNLGNYHDDYLLYGITQDCQMFFIRPSQLNLLSTIRIDKKHSFCFPNLVQLHLKTHDALLLTFKQAANRICTLEVTIPSLSMLFGDHLFRYSLLNSLPYAACSHSTDQSFQLDPDLSFMDPIYRDAIYFIDAFSTGPKWKVLQFLLKDSGNLSMMNNLTIGNTGSNRDGPASEYLVTIDAQKDKLYRRSKFGNDVEYECSFEMLFTSDKEHNDDNKNFKVPYGGYGTMLNAQAVEENLMIYVETDRMTTPPTTRLNFLNISEPDNIFCLTSTNFPFEIGIVRESTLQQMKEDPQPPFGTVTSQKPKTKTLPKSLKSTTKLPISTKSVTSSQVQNESVILPTSDQITKMITQPKSREAKSSQSPSKSFFSYETPTPTEQPPETSTLTSTNGKEMSNEIPVAEIVEEEEEEEFNEIIKELKNEENEDIGEMRTSESTTTTTELKILNNQTADGLEGSQNKNSSAVTGSCRKRQNIVVETGIVTLALIYLL